MVTTLQKEIDAAHYVTFLTGAGVSTPSGIPDYRSKGGLYTNTAGPNDKPAEYYLSHECLVNEPEVFYKYVKNKMYYPNAKPNVIHEKQAALTRQGRASIITQNIDNLYNKANSKFLVEFHGNLFDIYCQRCHQKVPWEQYMQSMYHKNCGGILRPNVVLYGEGLNPTVIAKSIQDIQNSDLVIIVGTSMKVYPFAGLLEYIKPNTKIIAINKEPLTLPVPFTMLTEDAVDAFKGLKV